MSRSVRLSSVNPFSNPTANQLLVRKPLRLGLLMHCFGFNRREVQCNNGPVLEDRSSDDLELIFEVSQVMRVPKGSQFLNRIDLW